MGTSISLGDYEPEERKEPWEEHPRIDLKWAYYTQSISMRINGLRHCVTALTSLKKYSGYGYEKADGYPYQQDKNIYASALNIYINNIGEIIGGDCVLTTYRTIADRNGNETLDKVYGVKKEKKLLIESTELHNLVIREGKVRFRNGNEYVLNTFLSYIKEATIVNRTLDQNYTRVMITEDKSEIEKILGRLAIVGGIIGFIPISESAGTLIVAQEVVNVFCFLLDIDSEINTLDKAFPMYDMYQIGKKSFHQDYLLVQGQDGEFYQKKQGKVEQRQENILDGILPIVEYKKRMI
ncbi:hypothetical protein [Flavobacterium sp. PL02]|uniref:hypothetical protein n=1 Tax=Flavobacterium sp. PL02 TaxID=3088354 RepID=UPI002B2336FE|nr:hypothetical protein [Flavobacterium sp. PL02]MEA9412505.1 hypothetical protein [Flavobacterium sp. PL02]